MMRVENGGMPALRVRPSYHAALLHRLKMDWSEVQFALMEARMRCLLREFRAEMGRRLADGSEMI